MKTQTRISVALAIGIIAACISGCSDASHSKSFLAALQKTQSHYQATAGAEHPGIAAALNTRDFGGGNATAVMSRLGALMQKDYKSQVEASIQSLSEASRHFQALAERPGVPAELRTDFQTYSEIIQRNRSFFTTTEPLSQLERWFNDYADMDSLYQRLVDGVSRLGTH